MTFQISSFNRQIKKLLLFEEIQDQEAIYDIPINIPIEFHLISHPISRQKFFSA